MNLDTEVLRCREAVAKLQTDLDMLRKSLEREKERLTLLERLRALELPRGSTPLSAASIAELRSLENAVVDYLRAAAKPLHISTIRTKLVKDGIPIPGKGVDANVITRLRRDSRIARAPGQRGFYLLAAGSNERGNSLESSN